VVIVTSTGTAAVSAACASCAWSLSWCTSQLLLADGASGTSTIECCGVCTEPAAVGWLLLLLLLLPLLLLLLLLSLWSSEPRPWFDMYAPA
jgi:hypothetical protein